MKRLRTLVLLLALGGCAATDLPPVSDEAAFRVARDEKRIWLQAWQETDAIDRSGMLYEEAELEAYVNSIARRLQPPSVYRNIPFAIRIIRDPYLNAFAFPNGMIYIHSGLLAAMESEAQLAVLVAHEMTHATHRHAVREFRHEKNEMAVAAAIRTVIGGHRGELSARASVTGYARALEAEADEQGIELAVQAGYDPRDAIRFYEHLQEEIRARDVPEPFFYGTHPRIQERIDSLAGLLASRYAGVSGIANAAEFFRRTAGLVLDNAALDIRAGRFSRAQRSLDRYLVKCPADDARPHYLLAELHRKRNFPGDPELAAGEYEKAIALDPELADAHRGLGLLLHRMGQRAAAEKHFQAYLALKPRARDRAYLKAYGERVQP